MTIASADQVLAGLQRTLTPRSIAVVGASPEPGAIGSHVLANLEAHGFAGDLHLVSRTRDEIHGRPCVRSVNDLPHGVDVVVLCIPESGVLEAIEQCGPRDVGGVVVFASGYAEASDEGRVRQEALAAAAQAHGMVLIGPNCMGYTSYLSGVPVTFEPIVPLQPLEESRGVAIVAQSGATAANIRDALLARWVPVSVVASTGNEAQVGVEDYVDAYLENDRVAVIAVYAEQIRQPVRFLALAARARQLGKPLALLMPGKSQRARDAAASHTGALAGDHASATALLQAEAVVLADSLDELCDVASILLRYPQPSAHGPAIITGSGAIKSLSLDHADALGLDLPAFTPDTVERLVAMLPDYAVAENPLDYTTISMRNPAIVSELVQVAMQDGNVGGVVLTMISGPAQGQRSKAASWVPAMANQSKPAVLVALGDGWPLIEEMNDALRQSRAPWFRSLDRALRALARVAEFGAALARASRRESADAAAAVALPGPLAANGIVPEYQGKRWLADLAITVPQGTLARDVDEALAAADTIGYPVVLKAQAAELPHKSDVGGVKVGIADAAALRSAWQAMYDNLAQHRPGLVLDGLLVEGMGAQGLELVVGARRDPQWGPVVLAGLGGIWIEALHDVRLMPADLAIDDIVAELRRLKGAALLDGLRGAEGVDVQAVARVVSAIGRQMRANPDILEIDVNPLIAYPDRVLALDALVVCAQPHRQPEAA